MANNSDWSQQLNKKGINFLPCTQSGPISFCNPNFSCPFLSKPQAFTGQTSNRQFFKRQTSMGQSLKRQSFKRRSAKSSHARNSPPRGSASTDKPLMSLSPSSTLPKECPKDGVWAWDVFQGRNCCERVSFLRNMPMRDSHQGIGLQRTVLQGADLQRTVLQEIFSWDPLINWSYRRPV